MVYGRWKDPSGKFIDTTMVYTDHGTIFNPTEEQLLENGFTKYEPPVYEPTEEELLENKRGEILKNIDEYDTSDNVNSFTIGNQTMWLTFEDRSRIKASLEAYEASGAETMTKWFGDAEYTFPISTWKQMLVALEVYASEAFNVTQSHKAAVNALDTIEALENYDYTTGYPTKLNF
jgi:hypothetical protein